VEAGLQQAHACRLPLRRALERRLHQPRADALVLPPGSTLIGRGGDDAALVEEVAAITRPSLSATTE